MSEVSKTIPLKELERLYKLADEAVSPEVTFSEDYEKMKIQADDIKRNNILIIWNALGKLTDHK